MSFILVLILGLELSFFIPPSVAPPREQKPDSQSSKAEGDKPGTDEPLGLHYEKYFRQVMDLLESDSAFKKALETANLTAMKDMSKFFDLVGHRVRTRLDEYKRKEVQRLNKLKRTLDRRARLKGAPDRQRSSGLNVMDDGHINYDDAGFEKEDLSRLIEKTVSDLQQVDKRREEEFKQYEMQKARERRRALRKANEAAERARLEAEWKAQLEKQKAHEKVNHPGRQEQLEEVWEKQDQLSEENFDPRSFFFLHDMNQDGYWDIPEVEAIMKTELDKVYPNGSDLNERFEEMNRMREEAYREYDKDGDHLISLAEFLEYSKTSEFKKDDGNWPTLEDSPQFSSSEFQNYEKENQSAEDLPPPVQSATNPLPGDAQQQPLQFGVAQELPKPPPGQL